MKDGVNFLKEVFKLYPNVPVFLMGRGIGGLISLTLHKTEQFKISGIVLMAPTLKRPTNSLASSISNFALKLIPNFTGLFKINFAQATRNPSVVEFLEKDPLVYHEKVTVGSLTQMTEIMETYD